MEPSLFIQPDWPVPKRVMAGTTLRTGGVSLPPYDSLNLAVHVGDTAEAVANNRRQLQLPHEPVWLQQTHGTRVIDAAKVKGAQVEADAAYTQQTDVICVVLTADCLPLLMCNQAATEVAAVHVGWRGMSAGIIEAAVQRFQSSPAEIYVWLGPGIGSDVYEVGDEVRDKFVQHHAEAACAFRPSPQGRWLADMVTLARQRLQAMSVTQIYGGEYCTYREAKRFYSYRRDGVTGRMASLIWLLQD